MPLSTLFMGERRTCRSCLSKSPLMSIHPLTCPFVGSMRTMHSDAFPWYMGYTLPQSSSFTHSSSFTPKMALGPRSSSTILKRLITLYVSGSTTNNMSVLSVMYNVLPLGSAASPHPSRPMLTSTLRIISRESFRYSNTALFFHVSWMSLLPTTSSPSPNICCGCGAHFTVFPVLTSTSRTPDLPKSPWLSKSVPSSSKASPCVKTVGGWGYAATISNVLTYGRWGSKVRGAAAFASTVALAP
mmetsp:Transcript_31342/g.78157  ORF Transcript_31342/g.78157 Transcript_31342/m.78157 type:complete len:243 (-) Transcript_31342:149-877(-)